MPLKAVRRTIRRLVFHRDTPSAKEAFVTGVFRYANRFRTAITLLATGAIDPTPLITHRFRFPDADKAIVFASRNRQSALKTMVNFD